MKGVFFSRVADEILHISRSDNGLMTSDDEKFNTWEQVINKSHVTAWRKPIPNSYLYEYKGDVDYYSM